MTTIYDRWVGIAIPESKVDDANVIARNITGNQADLDTFVRRAFDINRSVFYVAMVPMREAIYESLPTLQPQLQGTFVLLATKVNGSWNQHKNFQDWLDEIGLELEQWEEDSFDNATQT